MSVRRSVALRLAVSAALAALVGLSAGCGGPGRSDARAGAAAGLTVGVHGSVAQVVIPGAECEPIPLTDRRQPVVVRITGVWPHGTDFRYDLDYYGLEPGTYDLRAFLRRKDGSPLGGEIGTAIRVAVIANLPDGQVRPSALDEAPLPSVGGYSTALWIGGVVWTLGLLAFLFLYSKRRDGDAASGPAPPTLADTLRPLVEQARAGTLDSTGKAELERLVLGYWGGKLGIASIGSVAALQQLKADAEAGALLRQLETWLHAPPGRAGSVDLVALLAPYASIPADAVPARSARGGQA